MIIREKMSLLRSCGRFCYKVLRYYERIWFMFKVVYNSVIYFFLVNLLVLLFKINGFILFLGFL